MAYKNLLVQLDNAKSAPKRLQAAVELAGRFNAHLTGLVALGETTVPSYLLSQFPKDVLNSQKQHLAEVERSVGQGFEAAARDLAGGHELRSLRAPEAELAAAVSLHARYCDLAILGQQDEEDAASLDTSVAEEVLMTSGRPVLMIPYIGAPAGFGRRVMVAWNGSREAARAVNDALPLLENAEKVVVISVNPPRGPSKAEPGADIALHLARHGVKVEVQHLEAASIAVSDALLSRLSDCDSDLLVMGGYGHSRLRELVLGGVTREVLQHMTVPVLMSH